MRLLAFFQRRRRALVCRDAVALRADYLDGTLGAPDQTRLEQHLAGCPHCSAYLAQIRATIDALGRVEPEDLPDEAVDELVALPPLARRVGDLTRPGPPGPSSVTTLSPKQAELSWQDRWDSKPSPVPARHFRRC